MDGKMKTDDCLPAVVAQLPEEARTRLADFLRASRHPSLSGRQAEAVLVESLSLKDVLSEATRQ